MTFLLIFCPVEHYASSLLMSCGFPDSDEVPAPAGMAVALPLSWPPPFQGVLGAMEE